MLNRRYKIESALEMMALQNHNLRKVLEIELERQVILGGVALVVDGLHLNDHVHHAYTLSLVVFYLIVQSCCLSLRSRVPRHLHLKKWVKEILRNLQHSPHL